MNNFYLGVMWTVVVALYHIKNMIKEEYEKKRQYNKTNVWEIIFIVSVIGGIWATFKFGKFVG